MQLNGAGYFACLVLEAATPLCSAYAHTILDTVEALDHIQMWIGDDTCAPERRVAYVVCSAHSFAAWCVHHGIRFIAVGASALWPKRADTAARRFKHMFHILADDLGKAPLLKTHTLAQVCKACVCGLDTIN